MRRPPALAVGLALAAAVGAAVSTGQLGLAGATAVVDLAGLLLRHRRR